jgi:hypothetical protein
MTLFDDNVRYPNLPPDLNVKIIDLEIIKRAAAQSISRELLLEENFGTPVTVDVVQNSPFSQLLVRTTVRMLAKQGSSFLVTGREMVPANRWSYIVYGLSGLDPNDFGSSGKWLIRLSRAKTRRVETRATIYRTCPHLTIPGHQTGPHLHYLMTVNEEQARRRA